MIERLSLVIVLLAGVSVMALVVQSAATRWLRRRAAATVLAPSPTGLPRVIAFSSPGCADCRTQRRILDAVLAEWTGGIEIAYFDAIDDPDLAARFGVILVPTTVVAAPDGRVVGINGGLTAADRLLTQICTAAA
jgi:thioredoxin-like negative regulator of GroEL